MTYVPFEEESRSLESSQDASPVSKAFRRHEQLSLDPRYAVKKYHDKDDAGYIPTWKIRLHRLLPLSSVCAIGAYWLYFAFRVKYTLALQYVKDTVYPVAWMFLAIEVVVACEAFTTPRIPFHKSMLIRHHIVPLLLYQFLQLCSIKTRHRPRLRVVGHHVPRVDVLITCAGEEPAVILDTLRAAIDVDWPRDRIRIIVLDDKASEEVRQEVQLLRLDNSSLHYSARTKTKGVPHHFKAGNLNHGLSYVEDLEGGKAEFVAALDADMIAERPWLRALLAHLLTDPNLALACPPQVSQVTLVRL